VCERRALEIKKQRSLYHLNRFYPFLRGLEEILNCAYVRPNSESKVRDLNMKSNICHYWHCWFHEEPL